MSDGQIACSEILYRRIPPGRTRFQPPDRLSSGNFTLKPDETGLSVYRASVVDMANVLNRPEVKPGSGVAEVTVGQIRALCNIDEKSYNLDVVPVNDENDPGHAEIRGTITKSTARALAKTFTIVVPPSIT